MKKLTANKRKDYESKNVSLDDIERNLLVNYCKRQWLRRNEEYKIDYHEFVKVYKKFQSEKNLTGIGDLFEIFLEKWGIDIPFDPTFDPPITYLKKKFVCCRGNRIRNQFYWMYLII